MEVLEKQNVLPTEQQPALWEWHTKWISESRGLWPERVRGLFQGIWHRPCLAGNHQGTITACSFVSTKHLSHEEKQCGNMSVEDRLDLVLLRTNLGVIVWKLLAAQLVSI